MDDSRDPPTGPLPRVDATAAEEDTGARVSFGRAGAIMSAGTALSRITGFVRVAVMAWAIGATESKLADTYNVANTMPNMVYQLLIGEILATIFLPIFVENLRTRERDDAWYLASSVLNLAVLFATVFSVLAVVAAPWLIQIFTFGVRDPGLRAQQNEVGAFFLRIFMPQMAFYAAGAVLTSLLNTYRRFGPPMFAPVLNNLIVIATFVVFRLRHRAPSLEALTTGDKVFLAGGTTLGVIAMTLVLIPSIRKLPGKLKLRALAWRDPAMRRVGTLAKFAVAYVIANQVALWAVYALANRRTGGVTVYQFGWIFYQLPYGIFAVSIITFVMREISEHNVTGDRDAMRRDVSLGLRSIAFIILPASAGFVALARPMIRLLLEHGRFGVSSTDLAAQTFALMAIGLGAYAAFQQLMRTFYGMQDTRTPFFVVLVQNGINIAAAIPLYLAMGVPGLGLAHAISYVAGAAMGGVLLRRRLGGIDGRRLASSMLRIGAASVVTGAVAYVVARAVGAAVDLTTVAGQAEQVLGAVVAGVVVYAGVARALGVEEFRPLAAIIASKLRRRSGTEGRG